MRPGVAIESQHPAHVDDKRFFQRHPNRHYRARTYVPGETPAVVFAGDEFDRIGGVNLVIVNRLPHGRLKRYFHTRYSYPVDTDKVIETFLHMRGVELKPNGVRGSRYNG